jgi:hypothetical protein
MRLAFNRLLQARRQYPSGASSSFEDLTRPLVESNQVGVSFLLLAQRLPVTSNPNLISTQEYSSPLSFKFDVRMPSDGTIDTNAIIKLVS